MSDALTVFIHIHRTGGLTVHRMLERRLGDAYVSVPDFKDYESTLDRVQKLGKRPRPALKVLRGHMAFGVRQWLPDDARYVTIVRDPVERVISHYFHIAGRAVPPRPFGQEPVPADLTLHEFAAGDYVPANLQTRMLSDATSPLEDAGPERLEEAKRNLRESFAAVGLTERFDESLILFRPLLGLSMPPIYKRAAETRQRPARSEVAPETVALIEERNALDLQLYELARRLVERQVAERGEELTRELTALRASQGRRGARVKVKKHAA